MKPPKKAGQPPHPVSARVKELSELEAKISDVSCKILGMTRRNTELSGADLEIVREIHDQPPGFVAEAAALKRKQALLVEEKALLREEELPLLEKRMEMLRAVARSAAAPPAVGWRGVALSYS